MLSSPAIADQISFSNWSGTESLVTPSLTVDGSAADYFLVTVGAQAFTAGVTSARLTGVFVDLGQSSGVFDSADVYDSSPSYDLIGFETNNLDNGITMQGGSAPSTFDVGIGFTAGSPNGILASSVPSTLLTFKLAKNGLSLDDWAYVGTRWQTVEPGGGSDKEWSMTSTVVPIPAAAWLFGSALFGMAGIGYRRSKTA
jgi:hypothetical protein